MINVVSLVGLFYQWASYGGPQLYDFFARYEDLIIYTIPFLLIFAIVYGVLNKTEMFGKNRAVPTIIGLAVAFLALWEGTVISFFSVVFPNLGIAIACLLAIIILLGLFMSFEKTNYGTIILWFVGAAFAVIVILTALADYDWWGSYWWNEYSGLIVLLIVVAIVVGVVVGVTGKEKPSRYRWLVPGES